MRNLLKSKTPACTTNFSAWLAVAARATRDPAGDLVGDMRTDASLPEFCDLEHVIKFLRRRDACDGALAAAPGVWRRYQRWRK